MAITPVQVQQTLERGWESGVQQVTRTG
jgi:hypothetical protein